MNYSRNYFFFRFPDLKQIVLLSKVEAIGASEIVDLDLHCPPSWKKFVSRRFYRNPLSHLRQVEGESNQCSVSKVLLFSSSPLRLGPLWPHLVFTRKLLSCAADRSSSWPRRYFDCVSDPLEHRKTATAANRHLNRNSVLSLQNAALFFDVILIEAPSMDQRTFGRGPSKRPF
jgi:hypothetical protein